MPYRISLDIVMAVLPLRLLWKGCHFVGVILVYQVTDIVLLITISQLLWLYMHQMEVTVMNTMNSVVSSRRLRKTMALAHNLPWRTEDNYEKPNGPFWAGSRIQGLQDTN
jgi:hypothetical protein